MIRVGIKRQEQYVDGRSQGYLLEIEIIESTRTPVEVFMIECDHNRYNFSHIASPVDVIEYGKEPLIDTVGYYRTNLMKVILRCRSDADEFLRLLQIDLDELDRSYKNFEVLTPQEEIIIDSHPEGVIVVI